MEAPAWYVFIALILAQKKKLRLQEKDAPLKNTANKYNQNEILYKQADVTDRDSIKELFQWFDKTLGKIDCLIHAAGINVVMRSMKELTPENWDKLIEINLTGSFNVMHFVLERMRVQKRSHHFDQFGRWQKIGSTCRYRL